MATEKVCFNPNKATHVGSNTKLHKVVSNELGRVILMCGECVEYYAPPKSCDLCGNLCLGPTLELPEKNTVLKPSGLGDEVYCYNCVGEQLPQFMSDFFQENPNMIDVVFNEYYAIHEKRIDFSTADTIAIQYNGREYRRGQENKMSGIAYAMSELATYSDEVEDFLRNVFIPEMHKRRSDELHLFQNLREERIAEGIETIDHFIPTARGHPRVGELLPSRYVRAGSCEDLPTVRANNDFGGFLNFLSGN